MTAAACCTSTTAHTCRTATCAIYWTAATSGSFTPDAAGYVGTEFSPDTQPSEYSCNGTGDFRISALQIRNADGNIATDIRYVSHRILSEKPALPGMPSLRDENGDSETLEVTTLDQTTNAEVKLYYTVYKDLPVMTRHAVVTNTSDRAMELERVFSTCLDFNTMDYDMVHLYGKWAKERTVTERPLCHGIQPSQSKRGSSSHNHNPFVALQSPRRHRRKRRSLRRQPHLQRQLLH